MMKNLCFCVVFAAVFSAAAYDDVHLSVDGDNLAPLAESFGYYRGVMDAL